jgi:hypothetical protein
MGAEAPPPCRSPGGPCCCGPLLPTAWYPPGPPLLPSPWGEGMKRLTAAARSGAGPGGNSAAGGQMLDRGMGEVAPPSPSGADTGGKEKALPGEGMEGTMPGKPPSCMGGTLLGDVMASMPPNPAPW